MAYSATPFSLDDHKSDLQKLWRESLSDPRIAAVIPERLEWFYTQNPAGPAQTWLGKHTESDSIIGCGSFFPRSTLVDGRVVKAGVLSDFAVTKSHRLAGAAIAIQRALAKNSRAAGFEFLYGYPNQKSALVCKRVGYKTVALTTTWVKPLHSEYKVKQRIGHPALVKVASTGIDLGLRALDFARALGAPKRYDVEIVDRADRRFDDLWERAKGRYTIVGEKGSAYLNWRYARFTTTSHLIVCLIEKASRALAGYAVYSVEANIATIRDLFADDLGETALALLRETAEHLRRDGRSSMVLSFVGRSSFERQLRAAGFFKRPGGRSLVTYLDPAVPEGMKAKILDPASWFMIDGELDI